MIMVDMNNRNHEELDFCYFQFLTRKQNSTESDSSLYGNKFPIFEGKIQENESNREQFPLERIREIA
jgi:hypothetical protein